jgi:hypothetical protein
VRTSSAKRAELIVPERLKYVKNILVNSNKHVVNSPLPPSLGRPPGTPNGALSRHTSAAKIARRVIVGGRQGPSTEAQETRHALREPEKCASTKRLLLSELFKAGPSSAAPASNELVAPTAPRLERSPSSGCYRIRLETFVTLAWLALSQLLKRRIASPSSCCSSDGFPSFCPSFRSGLVGDPFADKRGAPGQSKSSAQRAEFASVDMLRWIAQFACGGPAITDGER